MANQFATQTLAAYNLKNWYQGPIMDQFNEDTPIYKGAEKGKHAFNGLKVIRPLRVQRNPGIGATSDGGNLPKIGVQAGVQAEISAKLNYLRFGITGPMIKAAANDKGSFVRQAQFEIDMGYKDLQSDVNRQLSWDGTGDIGRINTLAASSTTIVVKGREDAEPALKFLYPNMAIDIYSGSTPVATNVTINSVSSGTATSATATIVLDTAVSVSADDVIVRAGAFGNEVQGLLTQLDGATSTVFGIDRATYTITQGNVLDFSNGQMTLDQLQNLWDAGLSRGGAKYSAIYSDFASRRMYQKLLTTDKRYVNSVKGDGGFSNKGENYLEFNGIAWVADKDCPQRIFMLPSETIEKHVLCEMEIADEQGSMYFQQVGVDAYEVRMRLFFNLFNAQAAASGVALGYTSP